MKKILIIILLFVGANSVFAQYGSKNNDLNINTKLDFISAEAFIGYGRTHYDLENYTQAGFVPVGLRLAILPINFIDFGAEFRFNAYSPTFALKHPFTDSEAYVEKFRSNYLGGFVRVYPIPMIRLFFVRAGLGYNFNNRKKILYSDDYLMQEPYISENKKIEFDNSLSGNIGIGMSIGENPRAMISILYNFKNNVDLNNANEKYRANSLVLNLSVGMGLLK